MQWSVLWFQLCCTRSFITLPRNSNLFKATIYYVMLKSQIQGSNPIYRGHHRIINEKWRFNTTKITLSSKGGRQIDPQCKYAKIRRRKTVSHTCKLTRKQYNIKLNVDYAPQYVINHPSHVSNITNIIYCDVNY